MNNAGLQEAKSNLRQMISEVNIAEYTQTVLAAFDSLYGDDFAALEDAFFTDRQTQEKVIRDLQMLCGSRDVNFHTGQLLLVLLCLPRLRESYANRKNKDALFKGVQADVKAKLCEGIQKYHVVGTDDAYWLGLYFVGRLYAIGRLGYELGFAHEYTYQTYSPDQLALSMHIPSGKSLTREDIIDSLKRAYHIFSNKLVDGVLPVICLSWLLYGPYAEIFDKGNLKMFRNMFALVGDIPHDQFYNGWRVFGTKDLSDPDALPRDTSLQRKYIAWLKQEKTHGQGVGVLLFDGENILTEKREDL